MTLRPLAVVAMACLLCSCSSAVAQDGDIVSVPPSERSLRLPMGSDVVDALRTRSWTKAHDGLVAMDSERMAGTDKADWAFVTGFAAIHTGKSDQALSLLPHLDGGTAPAPYVDLVRGEVLLAADQPLEALQALARVPETSVVWPRAAVQQAEALADLSRTKEAREVWERLVARPDPAEGNAEALWALARAEGIGSERSGQLLRRLWSRYPTHEKAKETKAILDKTPGYSPGREDVAHHAEGLMYARQYDRAIALTDRFAEGAGDGTETGCRVLYTRGRSHYKKNRLSASVGAFGGIGAKCADVEADFGPRGLYLIGTAEYRRKRFAQSAAAYEMLFQTYADHSMADDALTRGGISLQEAGKLDEARRWWEQGLEAYPEGDTVPEATWRLAFGLYLDGDTPGARAIAVRLAGLDPAGDHAHVEAGRYWSARWLLYPDADEPTALTTDPKAKEQGLAGLAALCREQPHSFYAILAYGRLLELAPEVAADVAQRPASHDVGATPVPWEARRSVAEDPHWAAAVSLARLGLIQEAMAEWGRVDEDLTADEAAWKTELRIAAGDWLLAHDDLRDWIVHHPVGTLGPREAQVLYVAYPDRYWEEVQVAVKDTFRYEPRLFHGLVREESNFNRRIVSFAGARGLSQLMPATAKQTAGWLGMTITMDDLFTPTTNLPIGAKYLDVMHKQLSDSPYLALAGYNGGAGNVNKWIGAYGNLPTDEFVERIPYRETRGYVKRVMGTWQTMRVRLDVESPVFPDLSRYNHEAKP